MKLLGVDTGGTFTDFVLFDQGQLHIHKVLSTPAAPEQAILQGIQELNVDLHHLNIVHGSTVATNAVLEGKGVKTAYITNYGLADVLTLGRQARKQLYNLRPPLQPRPVPKQLCFETGGRLGANGEVVEDLTDADLELLKQQLYEAQPQAIAINLLFSFIDDRFEKAIASALADVGFVCRSSEVLPEYKEYERGIATWLNAYVGPLLAGYLERLSSKTRPAHLAVMQSSGGTMSAASATRHGVRMLLSGPAGGLNAALAMGQLSKYERIMTFDMGGTSTDVSLIDGGLRLTSEGEIGGYPVAVPMVDMHTIGAGGGSIASVDAGGLLQVGPESAGAHPGPACYRQGGTRATVTDANLVLGRLMPGAFLGGRMTLDLECAQAVVGDIAETLGCDIEQAALGIVQLANEHMAQALRVISVQRGFDPQQFVLMSFGGAGGLHVCALADILGINQAMVPLHSGVLSALGMLVAPRSREHSLTLNQLMNDLNASLVEKKFKQMEHNAIQELGAEGVESRHLAHQRQVDLRYQGQSYCITVAWRDADQALLSFSDAHKQRFGHNMDQPIELVNLRVLSSGPQPKLNLKPPVAKKRAQTKTQAPSGNMVQAIARADLCEGQEISGPAIITEEVSTTYVCAGWQCRIDPAGNLLLKKL